jgi:checkpoint serine/threonine-protein kinase
VSEASAPGKETLVPHKPGYSAHTPKVTETALGYVSTGSAQRAVDLAEIEQEKENIMPMRGGRSAAALAQVFAAPDSARASHLEKQRCHFQNDIANAHEMDDPLEVYYRFVRWTIDNYPQGNSSESNLVPLLEQCTRTFRTDKRYKNDPRYLRCWLMYADNTSEPRIIFRHLEANGIGQDLAAYYEEYAAYLEKESR